MIWMLHFLLSFYISQSLYSFFSQYSLCSSNCVNSIDLSLSFLILFPIISTALFRSASKLFFIIVLFSTIILYLVLYFIISIFLVQFSIFLFSICNWLLIIFMAAALKSTSDSFNISFILVLASADCLFSSRLWFFWALVWQEIFVCILNILVMLGDSWSYLIPLC